ncbi:MAG: N-acetylglucosamine-6-phosphate deacetylase [Lachnospiraceae bacterium]|jgi:N-acetylglucosamine-6-phosphate deacetylase|nr:N-acetylglucosamine-6-phosphate deacetylase [Lachnospiraceae bacterium]
MTRIVNGTVFTEEAGFLPADLTISEGLISAIEEREAGQMPADIRDLQSGGTSGEVIDADGKLILPGLVDIHFHGCAGSDFCDGTAKAFRTIENYELTHGITSICPAIMTIPIPRMESILKSADEYITASKGESILRGVNLEGPFLSRAKCGAQNPAYLAKPDAAAIRHLIEVSGGLPKLITIAPELEDALSCIRELSEELVVSLGHTAADYDTACDAFAAGATHVTHLCNAMQPLLHRAPGLIGAAADCGAEVEVICDGIHIHPSMIRSIFKLFDEEHVILISDSMEAVGMPDGRYELGGQEVTVKGHLATLENGTIAGSATNLYDCMVNAIRCGVPEESAILAATRNPARSIGIDDRFGGISEGKAGDLLITDENYRLEKVLLGGKEAGSICAPVV